MTMRGRRHHFLAITVICSVLSVTSALCSPALQQAKVIPLLSSSKSFHLSPHTRGSTQSRLLLASESEEKEDTQRRPRALGTLQGPTLVGSLTAVVIMARVLTTTSSRLFQQHVVGAVLGALVFLPAAIRSVQSRSEAVQAMKQESAGERRQALLSHIQAHFYLTYAAALCAVVSVSSIFYNKIVLGKPHFTSLHSRLGLTAGALWTGAYLVAQAKVWATVIKKRKWVYNPKFLWASKWHRQLGKAATVVSFLTVATGVGLSAWGRSAFGSSRWILPVIVGSILSIPTNLIWPPKQKNK